MTFQRRPHKFIKRQVLDPLNPADAPNAPPDPPAGDPPAGGGPNGGNGGGGKPPGRPGVDGNDGGPPRGGGGGGGGADGPTQSASQSASTSSTLPARPTESSTTSSTPPTTTSRATPSTTSTSTSTSTTSSTPTSTSTTSSTSSSTSPTSTSTHTFILTAPTQTNTIASPSLAPILTSSAQSPSATASPSSSSGVQVGSIVGGIAGGLVGIAVLGFLISFILRRLRKRNRRDTIIGDDFRRSEFLGSNTPTNDPPLQPPFMTQMSRDSTAGDPGMAGQGVFRGSNPMYNGGGTSAAYGGRQGVPDWGATATGAAASRHDYGQRSAEEMDDISRGIYSSQPQQQMAYNPEAYGSYATYAQDNHAVAGGYQEATREYQGQNPYGSGGYHGQEFGGGVSYDVAVADPGRSSPPTAGAYPSALTPAHRDQSNVAAVRQQNARSVVHDDDVYGGI